MRLSSFHEIEAFIIGQVPSEQCSEQRGDSQLKHKMTIPPRTIAARARHDGRRDVGEQARGGRRFGRSLDVEHAEVSLEGDVNILAAVSHGLLAHDVSGDEVVDEGIRRVARGLVVGVLTSRDLADALSKQRERVEQIRLGLFHVARHDEYQREAVRGLEREHDVRVLADLVVDDEALLLCPDPEPLVELELADVLLRVIAMFDELDEHRVVAQVVARVCEQLERGVDENHVVLEKPRADIEHLLGGRLRHHEVVELTFPRGKPVEGVEQPVEDDERAFPTRDRDHRVLAGLVVDGVDVQACDALLGQGRGALAPRHEIQRAFVDGDLCRPDVESEVRKRRVARTAPVHMPIGLQLVLDNVQRQAHRTLTRILLALP